MLIYESKNVLLEKDMGIIVDLPVKNCQQSTLNSIDVINEYQSTNNTLLIITTK